MSTPGPYSGQYFGDYFGDYLGADAGATPGAMVGAAHITFSATGVLTAATEPFGPPDWKYRVNTGGGPIGPFKVQRKRRRPQQQEDDSLAVDPWDQQFREIALAEDAEISEFLFGLVSSGVLDGHV